MPESTPADPLADIRSRAEMPALLRTALAAIRSKGFASIVDQVLVSATNFLTTVIVGRVAGQDSLGAYSLAFSVMLVVLCLQESLICMPYVVEHRKLSGDDRRRYAGSASLQSAMMTLACTFVLLIAALVLSVAGVPDITRIAFAFAFAAPLVMLRNFARRISFAHLAVRGAIAVDGIVFVMQIGVLLMLGRTGRLSGATSWLAIAGACGVAGSFWLWSVRNDFLAPQQRLAGDIRRGWKIGRWVLASQNVAILSNYLVYWLVASFIDREASGVLAACNSIILLANPVTLGTYAYVLPRMAEAHAEKGDDELFRVAVRTTWFLSAVMMLVSVGAFLLGDVFLNLVYGPTYTGNATVSGLIGLASMAFAVGATPDLGLWVKHRPELSFTTGFIGLLMMVALAVLLVPLAGLAGAAWAMIIGNATAAVLRWIALKRILGSPDPESTSADSLDDALRAGDAVA